MYYCKFCNYKSDDENNFIHHKISKKHLRNIINININIYRKIKKTIIRLKQKLLEQENNTIGNSNNNTNNNNNNNNNNSNNNTNNNNNNNSNNNTDNNNTENSSNNIRNKTINIESITCFVKDFENIPPLEEIINLIINDINNNKNIINIIHYYKNNILHELIGEHVINNFKNNSLFEQLFYVSEDDYDDDDEDDNDNDNYNDNNNNEDNTEDLDSKIKPKNKRIWSIGRNGYKICKIFTDKAIREIISLLKATIKNEKKYNELKYSEELSNILQTINFKNIKIDTNKYIADKFNIKIK